MMPTVHKARAQGEGQAQQPEAQQASISVPIEGLVETATRNSGFAVLENGFPTELGARVRGGKAKVANCGDPVTSLFRYRSAAVEFLFAATEEDIFDISALNPAASLTAAVSSQTAGRYSTAQLANSSGTEYLTVVNGADAAQQFDGSTWAEPTINNVSSADLSHVWTHKNRYWFVEGGTQNAWYLAVDAISGDATKFPLAGVFKLGGALLCGVTWSSDSGDGMDDRQVFISTLGEVAVYEGTDPASASTWGLVGVYKMDAPLGPNASTRAGGDVLMATGGGLVPLSAVTTKDTSALHLDAVSRPVERTWRLRFRESTAASPWEVVKWSEEAFLGVSLPSTGGQMLVANTNTGAWGIYTGWDVQCLSLYQRGLFFGSADGFVYQGERGGNDDGEAYVSRFAFQPNDFGAPTTYKMAGMMRAVVRAAVPYNLKMRMNGEYDKGFSAPPSALATNDPTDALWGTGVYDTSRWDEVGDEYYDPPITVSGWVSVGATGTVLAPMLQITSNATRRPDAELLSVDVIYTSGATLA